MGAEERQRGACNRCQILDTARADAQWQGALEASQRWAKEVEAALKDAGLGPVTIEPSNVQESPHQYVYIWPAGLGNAPYFIISEEAEYEDSSAYLVGEHLEGTGSNVEVVPTLQKAVVRTKELIDVTKRSN